MNNVSFKDDLTYVLVNSNINRKQNLNFPLAFSKEFKYLPIDDMNLSARASNVLKRYKVFTMQDLMDNMSNLYKYRNCGVGTVKEIKNRFLQFWYENIDEKLRTEFWEEFITTNAAA